MLNFTNTMRCAIITAEEIMYDKRMVEKLSPIMHIIKKSRRCAYRYARDVIRGRWSKTSCHLWNFMDITMVKIGIFQKNGRVIEFGGMKHEYW